MVTAAPSFSPCIAGVYKCNTASVSATKSAKLQNESHKSELRSWHLEVRSRN